MSVALLVLFIILLVAVSIYAILKLPSLAVAIGLGTFGFEQVIFSGVPWFQSHISAFNYATGVVISLAFISSIFKRRFSACHTNMGHLCFGLILLFMCFFWITSFWSPYVCVLEYEASVRQLPYIILYVCILPFMLGDTTDILRSFAAFWVLLIVGSIALLISPNFVLTEETGRTVLITEASSFTAWTNPLAIGDMGAYLTLTSILVLLAKQPTSKAFYSYLRFVPIAASSVLGLWVAFKTSRGEAVAAVLTGLLFGGLVTGRNGGPRLLITIFAGAALCILLYFLYLANYQDIIALSPRFSSENITSSTEIRQYLSTESLKLGFSSPESMLIGFGARGCEQEIGLYPHSVLIQSIAETGIIGSLLFISCYACIIRLGVLTYLEACRLRNYQGVLLTSFTFALLFYDIIVENKKGALHYFDTYMWMALSVVAFDRLRISLNQVKYNQIQHFSLRQVLHKLPHRVKVTP